MSSYTSETTAVAFCNCKGAWRKFEGGRLEALTYLFPPDKNLACLPPELHQLFEKGVQFQHSVDIEGEEDYDSE